MSTSIESVLHETRVFEPAFEMAAKHIEGFALRARHLQGVAEVREAPAPAALPPGRALDREDPDEREPHAEGDDHGDRHQLSSALVAAAIVFLVRDERAVGRPEAIHDHLASRSIRDPGRVPRSHGRDLGLGELLPVAGDRNLFVDQPRVVSARCVRVPPLSCVRARPLRPAVPLGGFRSSRSALPRASPSRARRPVALGLRSPLGVRSVGGDRR